jgi:putative Mg2+ transporter-C (MgtC) family protein
MEAISEEEVRTLLAEHGFTVANMSYRITQDGHSFEYRMTICTTNSDNRSHLAAALRKLERVREFRISPIVDQA